jgi:hypothetical protein
LLVRANAFGLRRHCAPFLRQLLIDFIRTRIAYLLRNLFALPRSSAHFLLSLVNVRDGRHRRDALF